MTYSDHPSIQGVWHPHVHSDPAELLARYPDPELGKARNIEPSASQNLVDMFSGGEKQNLGTPGEHQE